MAEVKSEEVVAPKKGVGCGRIASILAIVFLVVGLMAAVGVAVYLGVQWNDTTKRLEQNKADLALTQGTLEKKVAALEATEDELEQTQGDLAAEQEKVAALTTELDTAKAGLASYKGWHDAQVCRKTMELSSFEYEDPPLMMAFELGTFLLKERGVSKFDKWYYGEPTDSGFIYFAFIYRKNGVMEDETLGVFDRSSGFQGVFWLDEGCWIHAPELAS